MRPGALPAGLPGPASPAWLNCRNWSESAVPDGTSCCSCCRQPGESRGGGGCSGSARPEPTQQGGCWGSPAAQPFLLQFWFAGGGGIPPPRRSASFCPAAVGQRSPLEMGQAASRAVGREEPGWARRCWEGSHPIGLLLGRGGGQVDPPSFQETHGGCVNANAAEQVAPRGPAGEREERKVTPSPSPTWIGPRIQTGVSNYRNRSLHCPAPFLSRGLD